MSKLSVVTPKTADVVTEDSNPNFKSLNCDSAIGSATGGPMYSGSAKASINGSTNLSQCIKGRDAYINGISIERYEGVVYRYKIRVNGRGPSGFGQRANMTFTMQHGEQATLSLASTTVKDHTVKVRTPGLIMISWNFS